MAKILAIAVFLICAVVAILCVFVPSSFVTGYILVTAILGLIVSGVYISELYEGADKTRA